MDSEILKRGRQVRESNSERADERVSVFYISISYIFYM